MVPSEKKHTAKSPKPWRARLRNIFTAKAFISAVFVLALYGILAALVYRIPFIPREYRYRIGDTSVKTYYAPTDVTYLDTLATNDAKEKAAATVQDIYTIDTIENAVVFDLLGDFFREVEKGRAALALVKGTEEGASKKSEKYKSTVADSVSVLEGLVAAASGVSVYKGPDLSTWVTAEEVDYWRLRQLLEENLRKELTDEPIKQEDLDKRREAFIERVKSKENISSKEADLLGKLGAVYMRPNAFRDEPRTQKAKEDTRATVVPIYGAVERAQPYLKEGERITQTHLDIWRALGIVTEKGMPQRSMVATWVAILLLAIVFLVMLLYLNRFHPLLVSSLKTFGLFLLVNLISGVSGLMIGLIITTPGGVQVHLLAVAVVLNALLVCIYFNNTLGLFNSILWSGLFAAYFDPAVFFPAALCASLTCLLLRHDPTRIMLTLLVLFNALVEFFSLAALELFSGGEVLEAFSVPHLIVALFVGAIPVAVVFFFNMLIDLSFNLPTASRLNEFANLNHPLLRRLQIEAPGTYHHSIMVSHIAELAGDVIGANPLLIRVGSLYHDIGKGQRSEFFAENQGKGTNVHNKYSPSLSKIIIENHVRDGIKLAKRARLPNEIIDMIPQHHGTTLITYFFRKALAMSNGEPVNEHDFRYPGPKPQTPEAAVIFMSDAAESAARSLEEPTPHRIETAVNRLFEERLLDGQFDECGLTMDQLEKMKGSLISSLAASYHHRLAYPDEDEMKREIERGGDGAQPV